MEAIYLNTRDTARRFSIPARTLRLWREKRRGPVYSRVGYLVLYKVEDIESFLAASEVWPEKPMKAAGQRA